MGDGEGDKDGDANGGSKSGKKKRGRPTSWVRNPALMKEQGNNLVCQVPISKLVEGGQRSSLPCGKIFVFKTPSGTSTSTARTHLINDHKYGSNGEPPAQTQHLKVTAEGNVVLNAPPVTWTVHDPRTKAVTDDLSRWIAIDGRPANMVAGAGFKEFMRRRFPSYPVCVPPTISSRLDEFAHGVTAWAASFLLDCEYAALTTDGWKSDANEHYRTVTAHVFHRTQSWEIEGLILDTGLCGGKGPEIGAFLIRILSSGHLPKDKIICVTTDTAKAEKAGTRLAGLYRNDCGDHILALNAKLVVRPAKPAKNGKAARSASPVFGPISRLLEFGHKLRSAPLLQETFVQAFRDLAAASGTTEAPLIPTVPPATRWGFLDKGIQTALPGREAIDRAIELRPEYQLQKFSEEDWLIIGQVGQIMSKFRKIQIFIENERIPTVSEFLGQLLEVSLDLFYLKRAKDSELHPSVQALKEQLRDDLGRRLHESENEIVLAALAIHPMYKNVAPPSVGIPQSAYVEGGGKNILTFFFQRLGERMKSALQGTIVRLKIPVEAPPAVPVQDESADTRMFFISGYRHAKSNLSKPEVEINNWLQHPPYILQQGETVASYWEREARNWPIMSKIARPICLAQASNAPSERVWSLADDLSGDDRASIGSEMLNTRLKLKKNTPVMSRITGAPLFDCLKPK